LLRGSERERRERVRVRGALQQSEAQRGAARRGEAGGGGARSFLFSR